MSVLIERLYWLLTLVLLMLASASGTPARGYQGERNGRSYSDIARVLNPDPYAFAGSYGPFPRQPFWPSGP
ncbi:uncharacterized protein LOC115621008 [Scaptodrosophila lebanonensis]|uniref:Uncharacterized protein LOC115621008 n=1 Tax=Drosophila lebanonensis TaxID=7225 RepID=A0A6J2T628_DROLE|nr:uncharacterized protein LOC115621008 [Scaptodrosophila lebanonensis]